MSCCTPINLFRSIIWICSLLSTVIEVTGRYPHNLDVVLEQYTKEKTQKIVRETKEILTWLMKKSSKR